MRLALDFQTAYTLLMAQDLQLDGNSLKVLGMLRDRSMDGYTLMSKTALPERELESALEQLKSKSLVNVEGDLVPERMLEAYFSLPVDALGYADVILGRDLRTYRR